ncbi:MAG TPA: succinate dehydrogenase, cytochrome b556 subunit [Gallionella sp.]|nr:succinate dehydrogenase, cytochrome b556 subunit [Gallionella sp.]
MDNSRPKHLALHLIKQPSSAVVSILHRISGLLMFFALPVLLWGLQDSLHSMEGFNQWQLILAHPLVKLLLLVLLWALLHHFCAGLRFLAVDLHYVRSRERARFTSKIVLVASLVLTALIGRGLW